MKSEKLAIPYIFYLAAIVIVLGGVIYSSDIVTQFLMALFIAVIASKPVGFLVKKGLPSAAAVGIVIVFIIAVTSSLGGLIGNSVGRFSSNLDDYDTKISAGIQSVFDLIRSMGFNISTEGLMNAIDPGTVMNFTAGLLNGLGTLMGNMAMILLIVAFMLGESSSYGVKLKAIFSHPEASMSGITEAMDQINQYLGIKTLTSLGTGLVIGVLLWAIGVDFPFMWGVIAFLMNYIPNVGSILAAIPAMFMAFINLGGAGVIWTGVIFLAVNMVIGNIVEPKIMGKGLGISTLVVMVSLIFWGWILGTIGMFLSIPLTLAAKIAFESQESTRWISVLLGTEEDAKKILKERGEEV